MRGKRFLGYLLLALVIFFVVSAPLQSAMIVHNIAFWLNGRASNIADFVTNTVNK